MISCGEYDIIEIVCMYQYPIKLTLKSGKMIECVAIDTKRNEIREECILIHFVDKSSLIKLDDIAQLEVKVENPHIKHIVTFGD